MGWLVLHGGGRGDVGGRGGGDGGGRVWLVKQH